MQLFSMLGDPSTKRVGVAASAVSRGVGTYVCLSLSLVATMQFFLSNSILQLIARSRSPSVRSHTR